MISSWIARPLFRGTRHEHTHEAVDATNVIAAIIDTAEEVANAGQST